MVDLSSISIVRWLCLDVDRYRRPRDLTARRQRVPEVLWKRPPRTTSDHRTTAVQYSNSIHTGCSLVHRVLRAAVLLAAETENWKIDWNMGKYS